MFDDFRKSSLIKKKVTVEWLTGEVISANPSIFAKKASLLIQIDNIPISELGNLRFGELNLPIDQSIFLNSMLIARIVYFEFKLKF